MAVSALSFELCNSTLLARNILIELPEYISITHAVPTNLHTQHSLSDVIGLIYFMTDISSIDPNEFSIPVHTLSRLGFIIGDTFQNRVRQICNQPRDNLENELGFLKRSKLKRGVDFDIFTLRISSTGDDLDIEYRINTLAFHKLIVRRYDNMFLTVLNARTIQIFNSYQSYVAQYYQQKIISLDNTVHDLSHDIKQLAVDYPSIKRSGVFQHESHDLPTMLGTPESIRNSYISNASSAGDSRRSWPPNSNSPISILMESPRGESTSTVERPLPFTERIRRSTLNSIALRNTHSGRESHETHGDRESIPASMLGVDFDLPNNSLKHVTTLQKRFSSYLQDEPSNLRETMPIVMNSNLRQFSYPRRSYRHSAHH